MKEGDILLIAMLNDKRMRVDFQDFLIRFHEVQVLLAVATYVFDIFVSARRLMLNEKLMTADFQD